MKIYVVGGNHEYANWISNKEFVDTPEKADLVFFTGGEDVDPKIYNKREVGHCYTNIKRDIAEKNIFDNLRPDQHVIGVCRGSQLLCALNGGNLVQDCSNHAIYNTHAITNDELVLQITSTHHQMQYPFGLPDEYYDILFWAIPSRSNHYYGDGIQTRLVHAKEPEIVEYHVPGKPKCLAIQGHPEMMKGSQTAKYLDKLLNEFLQK